MELLAMSNLHFLITSSSQNCQGTALHKVNNLELRPLGVYVSFSNSQALHPQPSVLTKICKPF